MRMNESRDISENAEGTVCTFTGNFLRARILKRFSYETEVTLETISLNQVRSPDLGEML
jgi:hypothetical protein